MNRIQRKLNRLGCCLFSLVLLALLLPMPAKAEAAESKVVRVGWYEDSYNITGENGQRSGYGYEYEQAVAAYTGWTYEYVKAGWSDLLEMLENGEIDLMAGISYTDERAEKMLFSELAMGRERYYLYADLQHTDISASDLTTLNGKRIALMKTSVQATQFYQWEASHNLHLQYVWANSFEQGKQQAADREIDCVISTETPAWVEFGMSAIAQIGGSDIYFAISKDRPDLKAELDNAMRKMESDKPFYADELYQRYLSAVSTPVLSSEEQDWVQQHGALRIGFLIDDTGISHYDPEDSALTGVITDYVKLATDSLSNQTLDFNLVGYDTMEEEIQALKNGDIDLIFHFTQNPYIAEENGFVLSNTVLAFNMAAVTTENYFNETSATSVAIAKDNLLYQWYVSYNYPDWSIVEYDTEAEAEQAVRDGKADCFLAESGQLAKYTEDKKLHSVFLMQPGNTSFAVNRGNSVLMSILNKTLRTIPSSMLTGALSMYESIPEKVTLTDFIKDNLLAVSACLITVFALVLLLILSFLRKSMQAEAKARQAAEHSHELNLKLQESQRELEAALQRAEQANAAKTTFLSNMSHDIRTPMNAIMGISTLMEHELDDREKLLYHLNKLISSSQHLLNLINDILDMNKIESGAKTLNIVEMNMGDQIMQLDSVFRQQAAQRNQTITVQTTHLQHENVMADVVSLNRVLTNFLSNAVKYTPEGGHILFDIEELPRNGHYAKYKFVVQDNGIGMAPEFLEHIFEPFARAENSVTNRVQGTGLGMAIAKSIVTQMGGTIAVESELGKGSRFEITLDFKINETADNKTQSKRLLAVGCDNATADRIRDAVAHTPVFVYQSATVADAVRELKQFGNYDAALLPLSGTELAFTVQQLRAAQPGIIIVGTDERPRTEVRAAYAASGVDGFLQLPFFLSAMETEITRVREISAHTPAPEEDAEPLKGMHFLCAEDNELNAEILESILAMAGAACTIYPNGEEIVKAFETVQPGDYDMILMDVQMPVMNGYDATRAIRSGANPLGRKIPILAMTANAFTEDVEKSIAAGMDAHISKPVNLHVLVQTVRRFRVTPPRK